jgi:membrane protease YdiL (CAAX protease family)
MAAKQIRITTLSAGIGLIVMVEAMVALYAHYLRISPLLLLGAIRIIEIGGLLGIILSFERNLASIGWSPSEWVQGIKKGILWSLGFGLLTGLGMALVYILGHNPVRMVQAALPVKGPELLLFFLIGGFIGPLAEELCFRGLIYTFFRRWGVAVAIVVSTALFAGLHLRHGLPVVQIVGGLLFATAYEISRNLMTPIVIHVLANLAIFSLSLL